MTTCLVQVAPYKDVLFSILPRDTPELQILELGIGTGPNLRYYARPGVHVTSVDPNPAMRPFALASASRALIDPHQLAFLDGVRFIPDSFSISFSSEAGHICCIYHFS